MGQYPLRRPPAASASTAKGQHPPATSLQKDRPGKSLIIGIAGLLSIAVVGTPVIIDLRTPRVTSIDYIDVSDSAQKYKPFLEKHCRDRLENLKDGDILIDGKFTYLPTVTANITYDERNKLKLQEQCTKAATQPQGIGQQPGTSLIRALESIQTDIQHQRTLGNHKRVVVKLVIQAAEPGSGQPEPDINRIKDIVQDIVKDGGIIAITGPEILLQSQLNKSLAGVKNTKVCTFEQDKDCAIDWAFEIGRKPEGR